jgi:hypothetical protein
MELSEGTDLGVATERLDLSSDGFVSEVTDASPRAAARAARRSSRSSSLAVASSGHSRWRYAPVFLLRKRGPPEQSTPHSSHRARPEVGETISGMPTPRPAEESSPTPSP